METLQNLIRNLASILLLAYFLEMLLPPNKMRGFVQLVMGLFVISAVLTPLTGLLKLDFTRELPAWLDKPAAVDMPVLALEESRGAAIQEQYRNILAYQISLIVEPIAGIGGCSVEVDVAQGQGFADYTDVREVRILYWSSEEPVESGIASVENIVIDRDGSVESLGEHDEEIKKRVAGMMQIQSELITVTKID